MKTKTIKYNDEDKMIITDMDDELLEYNCFSNDDLESTMDLSQITQLIKKIEAETILIGMDDIHD